MAVILFCVVVVGAAVAYAVIRCTRALGWT